MTPVIVGKSVTGESHIRKNIERQDSFCIADSTYKRKSNQYYEKMGSDVRLIAVADGHGSASCPYSKTGSQTAANVFCDIMAEYAAKYKDDMSALFSLLNREGEITRISKQIVGEWEKRILNHHRMERRAVPVKENGESDFGTVWKMYGSTLLGLFVTNGFIFSFQLGDGDINCVDGNGVSPVIESEKILGVETHSISKSNSWKHVLTKVTRLDSMSGNPFLYIVSTDGWLNSHSSEEEFQKTCSDYFTLFNEHGPEVIESNLSGWLSETSKMGCGDDITVVFVYFKEE